MFIVILSARRSAWARQPVGYCTTFGYSSIQAIKRLQFLSISKQERREFAMVEQSQKIQVQILLYHLPARWDI